MINKIRNGTIYIAHYIINVLITAKDIKGKGGKMVTNKIKKELFTLVGVLAIVACIMVSAHAYPTPRVISDSVAFSTDAPVLNSDRLITNSDTSEVFTVKSSENLNNCFNYYRPANDNAIPTTAKYGNVRTIETNKSYMAALVDRSAIRGIHAGVGTSTPAEILLKSRRFVPEPGIDLIFVSKLPAMAEAEGERTHVLIQFHRIPNTTERAVLNENFNVALQTYIPNNAWFADIPRESTFDIIKQPNVKWIGKILPDDKISPHIKEYGVGSWAVNPDGTVNLLVTFFEDVSTDDAKQVIEKYGRVVTEPSPWGGNVWTVSVPEDTISSLASEDTVEWIETVPPPKTINNVVNTE